MCSLIEFLSLTNYNSSENNLFFTEDKCVKNSR